MSGYPQPRDIYYPWQYLITAILDDIRRERKDLKQAPDEGWAKVHTNLLNAALKQYNDTLKEWVLCVLRYDPKEPLVKSQKEMIGILLPNFKWPGDT